MTWRKLSNTYVYEYCIWNIQLTIRVVSPANGSLLCSDRTSMSPTVSIACDSSAALYRRQVANNIASSAYAGEMGSILQCCCSSTTPEAEKFNMSFQDTLRKAGLCGMLEMSIPATILLMKERNSAFKGDSGFANLNL